MGFETQRQMERTGELYTIAVERMSLGIVKPCRRVLFHQGMSNELYLGQGVLIKIVYV
uniref:Uncharacterized protein n=1 Tax=Oryza brachyantha TaxID=4533 RepID=J3LN74_ORYBR